MPKHRGGPLRAAPINQGGKSTCRGWPVFVLWGPFAMVAPFLGPWGKWAGCRPLEAPKGPPGMHPRAAHGAGGRPHCQGTPKAWPTWPTRGVGGRVGLGAVGVAMHMLPVWPGNRAGCWKFLGKFRPPQARAGRWAAGAQGPSTPGAKPHGPQVVWGPLWGACKWPTVVRLI